MIKSSRAFQNKGATVFKLKCTDRTPERYENEFYFRINFFNRDMTAIERDAEEVALAERIVDLLNTHGWEKK